VEGFIMVLVIVNVIVMMITTEDSWFIYAPDGVFVLLDFIEYTSFAIFSIEYLLRLWVCTLEKTYFKHGPVYGRFKYMLSYNAIIDFVALIPSIIEINECVTYSRCGSVGIGAPLRLWRIVRILKLEHYSNAFATLKGGFTKQANLFRLVLIYPAVAWIVFATLLSFTETVENGANLETAEHFKSIPRALFPVLLMLSGEMPLIDFTPGGQIVVALLALFSLVIMATATGILASGFEEAMREQEVLFDWCCVVGVVWLLVML
jgi:voltage-gated potassium channel